jgi:ATP-dependent Clp protease protease subunit
VDQVRADTERDVVLTARAAVDYGLVDRVLDHRRLAPWAAH